MAHSTVADNPRAIPGHNGPPDTIETTWSVYREVSAYLAETPVIDDDDAAVTAKGLWDRAKIALDDLEADRDGRVRPLNAEVAGINAEYRQPRESLTKLRGELQSRMSAFALAEERRKAAEAAEARRRADEAETAARAAEAREREAIENAAQGEFTDVGDAIGEADAAFAEYQAARVEADQARRAVKGRIADGAGRAFTVKTRETLSITDPAAVVAALVAKTGGVPDKVSDALLSAARDYRRTFGALPAGVAVQHSRG